MEYKYYYQSPLGEILLTCDGKYLTGLWFEEQKHYAYSSSEESVDISVSDSQTCGQDNPAAVFEQTKKWLDIYFSGKDPGFIPPLKVNATPFRKRVCEIMLTIPFGSTMSYGDIANIIAKENSQSAGFEKRMSAQAVGGAVGHNPISLIIPCHRVLGSDGSLTGYGGGLDRKTALLRLEGIRYR